MGVHNKYQSEKEALRRETSGSKSTSIITVHVVLGKLLIMFELSFLTCKLASCIITGLF